MMLDLTPAFVASCGRCANEGISEEEDHDAAHVDLRLRGWTRGDRQMCPDCSKETSPGKPARSVTQEYLDRLRAMDPPPRLARHIDEVEAEQEPAG